MGRSGGRAVASCTAATWRSAWILIDRADRGIQCRCTICTPVDEVITLTELSRAEPKRTEQVSRRTTPPKIADKKKMRHRKRRSRAGALSGIISSLPRNQALTVIDQQISRLEAERAKLLEPELETAIEHVGPSSAVAAGKVESQRLIDQLNARPTTKLLSAADMAEYAGRSRNWPAEAARRRKLISVQHAGRTLYPAFQIDPRTRKVRTWVSSMAQALDDVDIDGRAFTIWSAISSQSFQGDRPADRAGDQDFLARASRDLAEV